MSILEIVLLVYVVSGLIYCIFERAFDKHVHLLGFKELLEAFWFFIIFPIVFIIAMIWNAINNIKERIRG